MLCSPYNTDLFAVVNPMASEVGPANVSFWSNHMSVIGLMTRYANMQNHTNPGFSVWHRASHLHPWQLITPE